MAVRADIWLWDFAIGLSLEACMLIDLALVVFIEYRRPTHSTSGYKGDGS